MVVISWGWINDSLLLQGDLSITDVSTNQNGLFLLLWMPSIQTPNPIYHEFSMKYFIDKTTI